MKMNTDKGNYRANTWIYIYMLTIISMESPDALKCVSISISISISS